MEISDLKDKTIGILGFAQEGSAIAKFLHDHGIEAKIFDQKERSQLQTQYHDQLEQLKLAYFSGPNYLEQAFQDCQIVFRSPGVKLSSAQISAAEQNGIAITSQAEWFFDHCAAKIIGVTGTKGKGTTSSFIYDILQAANLPGKVYLTGNIGKIQPVEFLEQLTENDLVVYELSSFQLEFLQKSPHIGICLMVTEDHLDYHGNSKDYRAAKQAITKFQSATDHAIFNIDYPNSKDIGELGQGRKWQISSQATVQSGAVIKDEFIQFYFEGKKYVEFDASKRILRGKHNLENIAAGVVVAKIFDIADEVIQNSIQAFKGLEHRLQFVREFSGVKYYNDSISTIPETTIAALKAFTEPTVLLLGGATKNLNYEALIGFMEQQSNLKHIVCIGQVGQEVFPILAGSTLSSKLSGPFDNFDDAVNKAVEMTEPGNIVLLSPAATSYDMFNNYKERGEKFVEIISNLQ